MIEKSLRKWLRPVVNRRKKLLLLRRLSIYWLIAALAGIALIAIDRLWDWQWPILNWALFIVTGLVSIIIWYKSSRFEPDYKAIARTIEEQNPELKATLLTAIEQQPEDPFGQLGYLQERVVGEALTHAKSHDWTQSVSQRTLTLARCGQIAALLLLIFVISQLSPRLSFTSANNTSAKKGYNITVSPGDTNVEMGTAVVITARFDGRLPQEVKLLIGPSSDEAREIQLKRSLEDPVFGGIISEVKTDMVYHIEYADKNTQDYKITVFEHPMLHRADANIVYPSYTNLPDKIVKDTHQIGVLEGSQVTLTFTLNKTVDSARLITKDGDALDLTMDSENPNIYTTKLSPMESRRYELKLVDAQGLANKVPPRFIIDVHKNLPPELRPTFPNGDLEASPLEEVAFEAEVSDDFGITAHGLSYTLAGEPSKDINLGQSIPSNKKQKTEYLLELEEQNAQPDQLLTYSFWAEDVGPDGNTRRTSSDLYFIEVRPFEEIFRENQSFQDQNNQQQRENQQQGQQGERGEELIQLQKQIISATWNIKRQADQSGSIDEQKENLELVRQSQSDALEQAKGSVAQAEESDEIQTLQEASKYMETSLEHLTDAAENTSVSELTPALGAEQSAYQELLKLRDRELEVARSRNAQQNSSRSSARSRQQLQQLELQQREDRYETQRLAQSQQQETQREDVQVLNRLRELARRQNEMANRLRETEAALREAQSEQQRQEISRELKRLREEQIETLRDVDELQQRMESQQNRQRMADASEQLSESRDRIQQSAEEIAQGEVSDAVASTTRAQRELEEMRDEFQRRTSGQFSEQMRNMREQAQQLDERQDQISEEMKQQEDEPVQRTLDESGTNRELADRIEQQRKSMQELLDQMKDVSEQSENSEPILSRRLYDTLRQTSTENVDRALEATGEALRRNYLPQARQIERQAGEGIENLRQGIEEAARSVLGDEAESLRLAREQLDELIRDVNEEAARAGGMGQQAADPNQQGNQLARARGQQGMGRGQMGEPNQPGNMQARAQGQQGMGRGQGGDPNQTENMQARAQGQQGTGRGQLGEPNQPENMQARGGQGQRQDLRQTNQGRRGQANPNGLGGFRPLTGFEGNDPNGPLTGRDFLQWSDRLRDVEEMLSEQELREEVATVRDRARAIRAEFTRHGTEPQWDTVEMQITKPLTEVRGRIEEELAKLASKKALVPIDRDPVPGRYAELVKEYYENLGGGD